ncbi:MAG: hypothetical protein IPK66_03450 [Rhodospirillales bacterium]|nr:hypothetical protein [Rhodospirillales bacterium]
MAEAQAAAWQQTRFDQADRERIRRTLLRYMEENRIGVPTLQKLVAEANDIRLDHLPLKTLQRFLADTHRSNDIMVRFCHRFAADLPDDDPLASLGEALVQFMGVMPDKADWQALTPELFGRYAGRAEPAVKGIGIKADGFDHWVPFSTLTVETLPARPFGAVREVVSNWSRTKSVSAGQTARRLYEGVLFQPAGALFAFMRNTLTGTPRLYWLSPENPFPLVGYGHESTSALDERPTVGPNLFRADRLIFERAAGGETI